MSHYIQADVFTMLSFWEDTDSEKGACGRYKKDKTREKSEFTLVMTMFTRKKAPAAAITTNTKQ